MSDDYGNSWKNISSNIPTSPVNVIREDSENENILYLGTDNGAYVSFNQGQSWEAFSNGLPNVAVHDIVIQPDAKHLLLGTHGRSIYKTDIEPLQKMDSKMRSQAISLFKVNDTRFSPRWGSSFSQFAEPFEPEITLSFYTNNSGEKTVKVLSEKGALLNEMKVKADKGFNYANYDLTLTEKGKKALLKEDTSIDINEADNGKYYIPKGVYTIQIGDEKTTFEVK